MSTKTAFKRVALVAAAALAIGGVSAVSAHAAANPNLNVGTNSQSGAGTNAGTQYAGPANSIGLTMTGAPGFSEYVTVTGGTFVGGATTSIITSTAANALSVATPTVGTITVSGYAYIGSGQYSPTVTDTVTITVSAVPAPIVYASSKAYIAPLAALPTLSADAAVSAAAGNVIGSSPVGVVQVTEFGSDSNPAGVANQKAVTASISGSGVLSLASNGTGLASSVTGSAAQLTNIYVYSSGVAGTGTITISVNGATVATKTVTFTGPFAKFGAATAAKSVYGIGANAAAITVVGQDALGNVAVVPTLTVTTSNSAVATGAQGVGAGVIDVTGVAAGTATITYTDAVTGATGSIAIKVGGATTAASSVALAFDAKTYAPGSKMTITVTAADSSGNPIADVTNAANIFNGGIAANTSLVQTSGTAFNLNTATFVGGVATYTAYAPLVAGPVNLSAVLGAGVAAALATTTITASATVVADTTELDAILAAAQDASDNASAAIDAANAATDAANAAGDAADAATQAAMDATDAANTAADNAANAADLAQQALDAANGAKDSADAATLAGQAATDAANAAADAVDTAVQAASDAKDSADAATAAANDAKDQASQALAAVNALAASVAKLFASVKSQIAALTVVVAKIAKAVKA